MATPKSSPRTARVEIDTETLARLIASGQMGAAQLKCLDARSKQLVWKICLNNCLQQ